MTTKNKSRTGRPTTYDEKYCEEIVTYFDVEPFVSKEIQIVNKDGSVGTKEVKESVSLPTMAGFAVKLGVCRDTLNEWASKHKEFSAAIKKAKACQERILLENGLNGGYDRTVAIFALKNLADWKDKIQQEVSGPDGGAIPVSLNITFKSSDEK